MSRFTLALLLESLSAFSSSATYKVPKSLDPDEPLADFPVEIQKIKGGETLIRAELPYKDILLKTEENVFTLGTSAEKKE